ncbi:MAG: hypothetical protein JNM60_02540 [Candidatus Competibacteraceae bacterium]|nr:hypothetical protein [Candidatus Competibacteraceae bacterium]
MSRTRSFEVTLLALGLTVSLAGTAVAQTADPATAAAPAASRPAAAIAAAKAELPYPDGEKWAAATEREKLAYLLGIMNMAMAEYQLTGVKPKYRTLVPRMVQSLDGKTLREIMKAVDGYYQANPNRGKRSIFEVIWTEVVASKPAPSQPANPPATRQ